jgi:hypothetical protein
VRRIFARGSTLGIRAVAVAVLALGLIGGLFAGTHKNSDTLTAVEPAAAEVTAAPEAIQELQAQREVKTRVAEVRQSASAHAAAVAQAQAKAKAAAEAARKAAAKAAADAARAEAERRAKAERASRSASRTSSIASSGGNAPPVPVDCESYSGNKQVGCSLLGWAGFDSGQMSCLEPLWNRESGWNERAGNQSSGAYGIPQALPGNKMAKYGADWEANPVTQIKWGLDYIKGRYGTPCGAWSAFQSKGWY